MLILQNLCYDRYLNQRLVLFQLSRALAKCSSITTTENNSTLNFLLELCPIGIIENNITNLQFDEHLINGLLALCLLISESPTSSFVAPSVNCLRLFIQNVLFSLTWKPKYFYQHFPINNNIRKNVSISTTNLFLHDLPQSEILIFCIHMALSEVAEHTKHKRLIIDIHETQIPFRNYYQPKTQYSPSKISSHSAGLETNDYLPHTSIYQTHTTTKTATNNDLNQIKYDLLYLIYYLMGSLRSCCRRGLLNITTLSHLLYPKRYDLDKTTSATGEYRNPFDLTIESPCLLKEKSNPTQVYMDNRPYARLTLLMYETHIRLNKRKIELNDIFLQSPKDLLIRTLFDLPSSSYPTDSLCNKSDDCSNYIKDLREYSYLMDKIVQLWFELNDLFFNEKFVQTIDYFIPLKKFNYPFNCKNLSSLLIQTTLGFFRDIFLLFDCVPQELHENVTFVLDKISTQRLRSFKYKVSLNSLHDLFQFDESKPDTTTIRDREENEMKFKSDASSSSKQNSLKDEFTPSLITTSTSISTSSKTTTPFQTADLYHPHSATPTSLFQAPEEVNLSDRLKGYKQSLSASMLPNMKIYPKSLDRSCKDEQQELVSNGSHSLTESSVQIASNQISMKREALKFNKVDENDGFHHISENKNDNSQRRHRIRNIFARLQKFKRDQQNGSTNKKQDIPVLSTDVFDLPQFCTKSVLVNSSISSTVDICVKGSDEVIDPIEQPEHQHQESIVLTEDDYWCEACIQINLLQIKYFLIHSYKDESRKIQCFEDMFRQIETILTIHIYYYQSSLRAQVLLVIGMLQTLVLIVRAYNQYSQRSINIIQSVFSRISKNFMYLLKITDATFLLNVSCMRTRLLDRYIKRIIREKQASLAKLREEQRKSNVRLYKSNHSYLSPKLYSPYHKMRSRAKKKLMNAPKDVTCAYTLVRNAVTISLRSIIDHTNPKPRYILCPLFDYKFDTNIPQTPITNIKEKYRLGQSNNELIPVQRIDTDPLVLPFAVQQKQDYHQEIDYFYKHVNLSTKSSLFSDLSIQRSLLLEYLIIDQTSLNLTIVEKSLYLTTIHTLVDIIRHTSKSLIQKSQWAITSQIQQILTLPTDDLFREAEKIEEENGSNTQLISLRVKRVQLIEPKTKNKCHIQIKNQEQRLFSRSMAALLNLSVINSKPSPLETSSALLRILLELFISLVLLVFNELKTLQWSKSYLIRIGQLIPAIGHVTQSILLSQIDSRLLRLFREFWLVCALNKFTENDDTLHTNCKSTSSNMSIARNKFKIRQKNANRDDIQYPVQWTYWLSQIALNSPILCGENETLNEIESMALFKPELLNEIEICSLRKLTVNKYVNFGHLRRTIIDRLPYGQCCFLLATMALETQRFREMSNHKTIISCFTYLERSTILDSHSSLWHCLATYISNIFEMYIIDSKHRHRTSNWDQDIIKVSLFLAVRSCHLIRQIRLFSWHCLIRLFSNDVCPHLFWNYNVLSFFTQLLRLLYRSINEIHISQSHQYVTAPNTKYWIRFFDNMVERQLLHKQFEQFFIRILMHNIAFVPLTTLSHIQHIAYISYIVDEKVLMEYILDLTMKTIVNFTSQPLPVKPTTSTLSIAANFLLEKNNKKRRPTSAFDDDTVRYPHPKNHIRNTPDQTKINGNNGVGLTHDEYLNETLKNPIIIDNINDIQYDISSSTFTLLPAGIVKSVTSSYIPNKNFFHNVHDCFSSFGYIDMLRIKYENEFLLKQLNQQQQHEAQSKILKEPLLIKQTITKDKHAQFLLPSRSPSFASPSSVTERSLSYTSSAQSFRLEEGMNYQYEYCNLNTYINKSNEFPIEKDELKDKHPSSLLFEKYTSSITRDHLPNNQIKKYIFDQLSSLFDLTINKIKSMNKNIAIIKNQNNDDTTLTMFDSSGTLSLFHMDQYEKLDLIPIHIISFRLAAAISSGLNTTNERILIRKIATIPLHVFTYNSVDSMLTALMFVISSRPNLTLVVLREIFEAFLMTAKLKMGLFSNMSTPNDEYQFLYQTCKENCGLLQIRKLSAVQCLI
ncbi:unnamed protein product [Didymodactylos carnosus]|uniref:PI4-kinase N-terminal domain-containing protein n=1 Tax=Didymodactylos carnosus TaxID=1234261 RepID=A0A8S2DGB6_9BILA|nr:unnamed protein product [Didymodactylos carnosus]CAF3726558.1 unnamed protein product [Didymodactylos carnosus]